ncbi:hypothetical protein JXA02_07030 [candidate division KSB1 bacterium]|nr:hypothetical protein [candidate division KSB1 bacterium]RQW06708.1 MAG: hypothetical protein EH222_08195 [candidate division KSB1 bacterium]
MDELFYFPTFDLLIKVIYASEANSIRYATHRVVKPQEKRIVERYVLHEIAPKTEYYTRHPSLLLYMGVDLSLKKELKTYQVKDTIKTIIDQKHSIDQKVQDLISSSLSNYYFERLGDKLLHLRHIMESSLGPVEFEKTVKEIKALLNAYNQNSGQEIDMRTILPPEAIAHYRQLISSE